MKGLSEIYAPALASGANLLAIAPLPAPGFVAQGDYKEGQRLALNDAIKRAAEEWTKAHPRVRAPFCFRRRMGAPACFVAGFCGDVHTFCAPSARQSVTAVA